MEKPEVALVHDYLVQFGGAEKTLESILELFPDAPVYTGIYNPERLPTTITKREIICPTGAVTRKFSKYLTFLMPLTFESIDLRGFDLVISDGTAWPKGVLTTPEQLHVSYVHTPPRFLYKYSVESQKRSKWYFKPVVPILDHFLRIWDYNAAQRPDFLLANSKETQGRIKKFYNREATVIYPPVETDVEKYDYKNRNLQKLYYVAVGRLAAYKNFELLVRAFNLLNIPLVIVGTGTEEKKLRKMAKENITFAGQVSEEKKHNILENSLGLIFPVQDEDLGIVPIEAMAHGKPVLAHNSGGPKETIREGTDGMFFENLELEEFIKAIKKFDEMVRNKAFDSEKIIKRARIYNKERFKQEFGAFVSERWEAHARTTRSSNHRNRS